MQTNVDKYHTSKDFDLNSPLVFYNNLEEKIGFSFDLDFILSVQENGGIDQINNDPMGSIDHHLCIALLFLVYMRIVLIILIMNLVYNANQNILLLEFDFVLDTLILYTSRSVSYTNLISCTLAIPYTSLISRTLAPSPVH